MKTKRCSKCGKVKPVNEFWKSRSSKDGLQSGCKKCCKEGGKKYKLKYPHRWWSSGTRSLHRGRGYKINITLDELEKLAKPITHCPICDIKLDWSYGSKGKAKFNSPTLDRINNEKTLTKKNVWIICYSCNRTKSNKTMKEFYIYCKNFVEKFKGRSFNY